MFWGVSIDNRTDLDLHFRIPYQQMELKQREMYWQGIPDYQGEYGLMNRLIIRILDDQKTPTDDTNQKIIHQKIGLELD